MHRSLPLQVLWLLKEPCLFIVTSLHFVLLNCIKHLSASLRLPFQLILEQENVARQGICILPQSCLYVIKESFQSYLCPVFHVLVKCLHVATKTQTNKQMHDKYLVYIQIFSIYHTSEQYFLRTLIGQLGGDQPSTIHL